MKNKIPLQAGLCCLRWSCKNVDQKGCDPEPKEGEKFVYCDNYKRR